MRAVLRRRDPRQGAVNSRSPVGLAWKPSNGICPHLLHPQNAPLCRFLRRSRRASPVQVPPALVVSPAPPTATDHPPQPPPPPSHLPRGPVPRVPLSLSQTPPLGPLPPPEALYRAFLESDDEFLNSPSGNTSGSTANVMLYDPTSGYALSTPCLRPVYAISIYFLPTPYLRPIHALSTPHPPPQLAHSIPISPLLHTAGAGTH